MMATFGAKYALNQLSPGGFMDESGRNISWIPLLLNKSFIVLLKNDFLYQNKLRLDWKTHTNPTCSVEQVEQLSSEHLFKTIINPFRTKPNNSLNWKAAPLLSPDNRVHVVPFNPVRPTNTQPAQSSGRWSMVVPFCSERPERQKANYLFRADPLHWLPTGRQTDSTDRLLQ